MGVEENRVTSGKVFYKRERRKCFLGTETRATQRYKRGERYNR